MNNDRYLKIGEVIGRTSYSRAQIYRLMKSGDFPKSYRLSSNRVAWKESEINGWLESRVVTFALPPSNSNTDLLNRVMN